ncbi:MAG: hypothetical protein ACKOFX_07760 [Solirubrobacterales bacterium]
MLVGLFALFALLPSASQAAVTDLAPTADGFLLFEVGVDIYDQAIWQYDKQAECDRNTGTGQHTISAEVRPSDTWSAVVPVDRSKGGARPVSYRDDGFLMRPTKKQWAPASYNLQSDETSEPTSNFGPCAPIDCGGDCGSGGAPPQKLCGTRPGEAKLQIFGAQNGKNAYLSFFDETWTPEDPFTTETSFCNDNSFWAWSNPWPGFETDDDPYDSIDHGLEISTSKLMGFFRKLTPKQREKCREEADEGQRKPKVCNRASYTQRHKVIQLRDINEPGNRDYLWQQSILTVEFRFDYFDPKGKTIKIAPPYNR